MGEPSSNLASCTRCAFGEPPASSHDRPWGLRQRRLLCELPPLPNESTVLPPLGFFFALRRAFGACRVVPALVAAAIVGSASAALGGPMDPALARLVVDAACLSPDAELRCQPDRASYRKLVSEWGFALAPASPRDARVTALGDFDVSLQAAFTAIDQEGEHWRRGTRGDAANAAGGAVSNPTPPGHLSSYWLSFRKGFGFGTEAEAVFGVSPHSSALTVGAQLRFALLEGLAGGPLSAAPDVSLAAALRAVSGMPDVALSLLTLEARVSEPFIIDGRQELTPWLAYQWVRIRASAGVTDFTPSVAGLDECGFAGENVPGAPRESAEPVTGAPLGVYDGSPLCSRAGASDVLRTGSFGQVEVLRHRLAAGAAYRREAFEFGLLLAMDVLSPGAAQSSATARRELECDARGEQCSSAPRQWTLSMQVGARF